MVTSIIQSRVSQGDESHPVLALYPITILSPAVIPLTVDAYMHKNLLNTLLLRCLYLSLCQKELANVPVLFYFMSPNFLESTLD